VNKIIPSKKNTEQLKIHEIYEASMQNERNFDKWKTVNTRPRDETRSISSIVVTKSGFEEGKQNRVAGIVRAGSTK